MKFSIVTVNKNDNINLLKTIQSLEIQNQDLFEWIFVDGGSTDNSCESSIKSKIANKKIISELDEGIFDAMNKGIKASNCNYIMFLNSGDTLYEFNTLGKLVEVIHAIQFGDIYYGDAMLDGGIRKLAKPIDAITRGMPFIHQAAIFKRTDGLIYDIRYKFAADYELVSRLYTCGYTFIKVQFTVCNYDMNGLSIANSKRSFREMSKIRSIYFGEKQFFMGCFLNEAKVFIRQLEIKIRKWLCVVCSLWRR